MEQELLVLVIAVFGASALQSATGIGFGVIAGPVLLIVLNDGAAIQISIVLNLLIALLLAPSLRQKSDRRILQSLLIGVGIGSPVGLLIYLYMDIALLKSFAGLVVMFTLFLVLRGNRVLSSSQSNGSGRLEQVSIGVIAGIMGGSLAMPGPVPAAWMSARGLDKDTIRATILVMFVVAYTVALLLQFVLAGISTGTLRLSAMLVPSTIAGIFVGLFLNSRISEATFRWLLTIILAFTAIILFATLS
jgi:uncharacterized membrane protein YfcA